MSGLVGSIPTRSRHGARATVAACSLALSLAAPVGAQEPAAPPGRPGGADTVVVRPPLAPRAAFIRSLLVPGWGQTRLSRPTAGAIFATVEFASLVMSIQSRTELRIARRLSRDSVLTGFDASGRAEYFRPLDDRIRSRKQQVEDWTTLLIFNHLFAAADAFVAAHLWDVPARVSIRRDGGITTVAARLEW